MSLLPLKTLCLASLLTCSYAAEHKHEHSTSEHTHTHSDGTVCTADHSAATHQHTASEHTHTHADGTVCTADHSTATHQHTASEHTHTHADGTVCTADHSAAAPTIIKVNPQARAVMEMKTEPVPAAGEIISHSLYGYLSMPYHGTIDYTLPAAGRIELKVKSAQEVKQDSVLFTVESPDIAQLILKKQEVEATLQRADADIATMSQRIAQLQAAGSRKSDLEEQLAFKKAERTEMLAQVNNSQQSITLMSMGCPIIQENGRYFLEVRAKQTGKVRNLGLSQGAWADRGATVLSMSDGQALEIIAQLYASNQPDYSHARAIIPHGRHNHVIEGSLRIAEQIDAEKQTRQVYFTPKHMPEGVSIGQLCRIDLIQPTKADEQRVSIPDSAIVRVGLDDMVFIDHGEGIIEAKKVQADLSRYGMTPVLGLKEGEQLVVQGAYEFKFVLPSEGEKKVSGHFHADGKFHEGEDH